MKIFPSPRKTFLFGSAVNVTVKVYILMIVPFLIVYMTTISRYVISKCSLHECYATLESFSRSPFRIKNSVENVLRTQLHASSAPPRLSRSCFILKLQLTPTHAQLKLFELLI